jgi:hypothetical protein
MESTEGLKKGGPLQAVENSRFVSGHDFSRAVNAWK